ncbi:hypothetical protein [Natrinema versiforme]|uniref:Sporulation control protein n=1 Tax=Natrinema versiforme JCM 10478 TaxID=1227496 RepID=L9YBM5_9EURY|nr:hypothetical protein [Natrinema versiforme]ELY70328.1 hypothetical protein C489_02591 [Natrinema versiforme JCM 10478]
MPAIALGFVVYLVLQGVIARFVYREAAVHNRRFPLIIAIATFVFSVAAIFLVESILLVLLVQAVAIALYRLGAARDRPTTPR